MKRLISLIFLLILLLILFIAPAISAQKVVVGVDGGSSFGNMFIGPTVGLEVPFAKRYELDLYDTFAPIEEHIALGHGWSNQAKAGGIVFLTDHFGLNGYAEYSNYSTNIYKANEYALGGVNYETTGMLLNFDYLREFNNGISSAGIESSHIQGGDFGMKIRTYCNKHICYRVDFDFKVGRVLEQGNEACDGSYGPVTCPRTAAIAGAFTGAFVIELGHRSNRLF